MDSKNEIRQILLQYEAWFETSEFERIMNYIDNSTTETRDCDSCFFNVIREYENTHRT